MEEMTIQNIRLDCSPSVRLTLGKYHDTSRARTHGRRKYIFTDQIDQLVREIYLSSRRENASGHPAIGQESRHAALGIEEARS